MADIMSRRSGRRSAKVEATPVVLNTCTRCKMTYLVTCPSCPKLSRELRAMSAHATDGTTVPVNRAGTEHG